MGGIFHEALFRPLFNLLIWLYDVIPGADFGFSIIALTVVVKLLLWPLAHASLKGQKRMQELQPKLDALKEQHKGDKDALAKAMMEMYQSEKVNPLSSCLPLLVQLPIIIALFQVLRAGASGTQDFADLYPFVARPESVNHLFLGLVDLAKASLPLAVLSGLLQFVQAKMLLARRPPKKLREKEGAKDEDMTAAMNKSMLYMMPVMSVVIGAKFPAGLTLYWVVLNLVTILQQWIAFRDVKKSEEQTAG
jgi:YidC/Oxa1 family membrane protein insertase